MTEGSIVLLPEIEGSGSHSENYAVVKSVINDDILEISILGSKEVIFIAKADVKVVKWQGRKDKPKKVNKKPKKKVVVYPAGMLTMTYLPLSVSGG